MQSRKQLRREFSDASFCVVTGALLVWCVAEYAYITRRWCNGQLDAVVKSRTS